MEPPKNWWFGSMFLLFPFGGIFRFQPFGFQVFFWDLESFKRIKRLCPWYTRCFWYACSKKNFWHCWWFRNPAPVDKYFIIYKVLYIPGGAGFLPSTVFELFGFIRSGKMHATKTAEFNVKTIFDFLKKRRMSDLQVETTRHNPIPLCLSTLTTSFTGRWIVIRVQRYVSLQHPTNPWQFHDICSHFVHSQYPPWNFKSAPLKILEKEIIGNHHF